MISVPGRHSVPERAHRFLIFVLAGSGEASASRNLLSARLPDLHVYIPTHLTPPIRFDLTPLFRWV